jgi:CheY-like chemotaxis protein/KaiC/GvpD/RAD55 family RecA-like ATPase
MNQRILIADDEPNILMLTSLMLEDCGYEVIRAKNGSQAVEKAVQEVPDLIITDVVMPEKDGFEVTREIRTHEKTKHIPIIILSAMGDEFNKITGFEGGADDYVTKPFNVDELKARVQALLMRSGKFSKKNGADEEDEDPSEIVEKIDSGNAALNDNLYGGLPVGSNILLVGPIGLGKSTFCREFIKVGLEKKERNMIVAVDDSPRLIRKSLAKQLGAKLGSFEDEARLRFIDAYSWSSGADEQSERFAVSGLLELTQLSGVIADAGGELGQTVQDKHGGRRVIDSISSLLVNFELSAAQRFLSQIARTAIAFGDVTTIFVLEEGTVSEHVLNNVKYIMDGVIQVKLEDNQRYMKIMNMKWSNYNKSWFKLL